MSELALGVSADIAPNLWDAAAEAQVLGSCMIRRAAFDEVSDVGVRGQSFYKPANETIFNAISQMAAENVGIDAITVGDRLARDGTLDMIGGVAYVHQLVQSVPTSWNVVHYGRIVFERWLLRRLFSAGMRTMQLARGEGDGEVGDILARARAQVDEIIDDYAGLVMNDDDILDQVIADLSGPKRYVATPWTELTAAIGGWRTANLYVVGARPSVGKTTVATSIMLDAMRRGMLPLLFSMEMRREQITEKLLSAVAGVDGARMLHHSLREDDERNLAIAAEELRKHRFIIDDRSKLSVAQIRATIRAAQRTGLPVLPIVDYIQIVKPADSRSGDRRVEVDQIAQDSKDTTRDLDVPMVMLAQLNREVEGRAVAQPTLRDLREAGGIEQAADTVALLHRATNGSDEEQRRLDWFVAKARFGRVCTFSTRFEGEYSRVTDLAPTGWS